MIKCLREAKVHSTWALPNEAYEAGTLGFVRDALDTTKPDAFLDAGALPTLHDRYGISTNVMSSTIKGWLA